MSLLVQAYLFVKRLVLGQPLPDVCNFHSKIEVFELEDVKMELALFCLYFFFCNSFAEELAGMQELFEQEASDFA